jgi:hypothetical protein
LAEPKKETRIVKRNHSHHREKVCCRINNPSTARPRRDLPGRPAWLPNGAMRLLITIVCMLMAGCYNPTVSINNRDALEIQLTRTAITRAVDKLAIHKSVLDGTWSVTASSTEYAFDDAFIKSMVERRLIDLGADVRFSGPTSQTVEVLVAYAGTDLDNFSIGIPTYISAKDLGFYQSITAKGRAQISLNFWGSDGKLIAHTPSAVADSHYTDVFILTLIGPLSFTDIAEIETSSRFIELGGDTKSDISHVGDWIIPKRSQEDNQKKKD